MQIVIDIPEELYETYKGRPPMLGDAGMDMIAQSIANGTPLPKGHGRMIDLSKIDDDRIESDNPIIYLTINGENIEAISLDYLESLPTIIPEDKGV